MTPEQANGIMFLLLIAFAVGILIGYLWGRWDGYQTRKREEASDD